MELELKNQAFQETKIINKQIYLAKIKIIKFLQPYILLKLAKNLKNNKLRLIFIISGAHKFIKFNEFKNLKNIYEYVYYGTSASKNMTYNEFLFDFKLNKIFTHWYQNPLNCDFESFNTDVKNKMIISDGFNGTPSGFDNCCENELGETNWYVLHAEANAILKVAKSTHNCSGATLYLTLSPCKECSKLVVQSGIEKVESIGVDRITIEKYVKIK